MSIQGQVVNLNKLAFEKDSSNKLGLLEKAYQLTLSNQVPVHLQVFTVVNLSSFYCKEQMEFRALCMLADTLNILGRYKENYWEKVLVIANLAKIKAAIHSGKEAISDLTTCLEFLKLVHFRDSNYYTVLATVHYNLSVECKLQKMFSQSIKHMTTAKYITVEHLGINNKVTKFLNLSFKHTEGSFELSPYNLLSKCASPENARSKSSLKIKKNLKFFKKFEKVSQSHILSESFQQKSIKNSNYNPLKPPLEALIEEEEFYCTSYPKLTLSSTKSNKAPDDFSRNLLSRDPDPEPSIKFPKAKKKIQKKTQRLKTSQIEVTRDLVSKVIKIQRFVRKFLQKRKNC